MSRRCQGCISISSACTGPKRGPVRAKIAENACMGPTNGPVRAVRERGNGEQTESPIPERKSPATAGLIRVYGQWDDYRTIFDDFREAYLLGIQLDME